ncbi:MAG: c-type cytochrome [Kofleriaceae bacterium]|nr:c-type cytochrome [Kofleriaceae bacterium]
MRLPDLVLARRAPALLPVLLAAAACSRESPHAPPPPPSPVPTPVAPAGPTSSGPVSTAPPAPTPPPAPAMPPEVVAGRTAFAKYCALCHGPAARGYAADNAPSLVNPTFLATVEDSFLMASIKEGRPGTAMAGYARDLGGPLDDTQIQQVIAFLRWQGPARQELPVVAASGDRGRGRTVYDQHCAKCHGTPGKRGEYLHLAQSILLRNVTDAFLRHAIAVGRPGTPMVAWAGTLTAAQIEDVVALLRSWEGVKPPPPLPKLTTPTGKEPVVLHPKGKAPAWKLRDARFVAADDVVKAYRQKRRMVLLDARPASDWMRMHIPGAVSVPHYDLSRLDDVPKDGTWVVAYCACPHHASGEVVDELRRRGYKNTAVLDEGILVWQQRGYPITSSPVAPAGLKPDPHAGHDHSGHGHP